ncbi:hypothetical protein O181_010568, partial [Austropuccinia psidii MF-1]|nr:hypothetical protein [Austropuccinia psidii MF-1]
EVLERPSCTSLFNQSQENSPLFRWKDTILNTISYVYKIHSPNISEFLKTIMNNDDSSFLLILRQTIDDSTKYLLSDHNTASGLLDALQHRCNRSGCLDKLQITNQFLQILNSTDRRDTGSWLHSLQDIYAKFMSWKMSFSEFFGLLAQANIRVLETLNHNTFDILLHQHLNQQDTMPAFETVSEAIQAAETAATVVINPAIINLDASVLAMRYFPPGASNSQPVFQAPGPLSNPIGNAPPTIPQHAIKKAAAFRGKGRHWYADCDQFWEDVSAGKVDAPHRMQRPNDQAKKGKARQVYNIHIDGSLLDSAADVHVSGINRDFTLERKLMNPPLLNLASTGKSTYLTGIGSLRIPTNSGILTIDNVYFCKDIRFTIISLGRLVEAGYHPVFTSNSLKLVSPLNIEYHTVFHNCCWYIPRLPLQIAAISKVPLNSAISWHERLGHASACVVKLFLDRFVPEASSLDRKDFFCDQCAKSKITKSSSTPAMPVKSSETLDLLVSDVVDPFEKDPAGNRFLLTMRDHASTFTFTAPLKSRGEVPERIIFWVKFLTNHLNKRPVILRSDNTGKYSKKLKEQLNQLGTEWVPTEPYRPDQNGEAERVNRTLGDMARTMLNSSPLPSPFWSSAYSCATHIHNRLPNRRTAPLSPMERLCNIRQDPARMYPFGAEAIVHIPHEKRGKLDQRGIPCRLLTFPTSSNGWIFYDSISKRIFQASSTVFPAYQALPRPLASKKGEIRYIVNNLHLGKVTTSDIAKEQEKTINQLPITCDIEIPKTLKHALNSPFSSDWRDAAMVELNNFKKHDVWEPTTPSKGMKVLGGKWVFDIKWKADGTIERLKARYVARGFSQRPGVDCFDVYAPTASLNSLRLLLALKAKHNFVMAGFDISAAYLYSPIQEEVYVQAPVELLPELNGKVMKLKKALYGAKQAARCWWTFSREMMTRLGFECSEVEASLYIYRKDMKVLIVWIHVDDGIVIGNLIDLVNDFKAALMREVDVRWHTKVEKIVGLHIIDNGQQIEINQNVLIGQYLNEYPRPVIPQYTTMTTAPLIANASGGLDTTNYQSAIGTLMYISGGSRPDITYAVHMLARFSSCPDETHWLALDHLTGYLLRHRDKSLRYTPQSSDISLWVDASWGGEHAQSTSGFVVKAFGNPIA